MIQNPLNVYLEHLAVPVIRIENVIISVDIMSIPKVKLIGCFFFVYIVEVETVINMKNSSAL